MNSSIRQKLGQLFIIGIQGTELKPEEKRFIRAHNIGGIILFSRNLKDPHQIHELISEIQNIRFDLPEKTPLFVAVDMEGGPVHRLKSPFTQWPSPKMLGKIDSAALAFKFAEYMGRELKAFGFNLDFAPSVDVLTNDKNKLFIDRAISSDSEQVAKIASALVRGYIKSEIITCAKHFPGHGNTMIDSHEDLPIEELTLERLNQTELPPFKKVFRSKVDMVMTAHIKFNKIDADWPVTLSHTFLEKILREEMAYRGLIITDDLDMKALSQHYPFEMIPIRSLQAGADILLYCNIFENPPKAFEHVYNAIQKGEISISQIESKYLKVMQLKQKNLKNPDPFEFNEAMKWLGRNEHLELAKSISMGIVPQNIDQMSA